VNVLKKLFKIFEYLEDYFLVGSLVFTVLLVFSQVIMRYVFNNSLAWSEELARYIFTWQVWLGTSYGIKYKQHIRVKLFNSRIPMPYRDYVEIIVILIWMAICVFLTINGGMLVSRLLQNNQLSPVLRMPMGYVYMCIPVSGLMMIVRLIKSMYELCNVRRCD